MVQAFGDTCSASVSAYKLMNPPKSRMQMGNRNFWSAVFIRGTKLVYAKNPYKCNVLIMVKISGGTNFFIEKFIIRKSQSI
jgi:hypothetical protein